MEEILIPKARIAPLIGEKGRGRKLIEKAGNLKLWINSQESTVKVISKKPKWIAEKVIEAVGRGFSPQDAVKLFKDDYAFEIVDIKHFTKKRQITMRGRVIGTQGLVKKIIQKYTKVRIVVQGKTISIIGKTEDVANARQAIEKIL